jgi:hypothetical protein
MVQELELCKEAFGVRPKMIFCNNKYDRLHPCCALIKNTSLFREIVKEMGLSCIDYLRVNKHEYWDTFKLLTKVMTTHNLKPIISSSKVLHFFSTSYIWEPSKKWNNYKILLRNLLLNRLRKKQKEEPA